MINDIGIVTIICHNIKKEIGGKYYVNMERHISLQAGKRAAFYEALCDLGVRTNSKQEEGNIRYDYYFAAEAGDDLLLVETWQTPELQQAHCQTEIFAKLQALKQQYCDAVDIDKYNF